MALIPCWVSYCLEVSTLGRGFDATTLDVWWKWILNLKKQKIKKKDVQNGDHFARGKAQDVAKTAQLWSV